MQKKKIIFSLIAIVIIGGVLGGWYLQRSQRISLSSSRAAIPTIYLPGSSGSKNTTQPIINYARQHLKESNQETVKIAFDGKVTYPTNWNPTKRATMIQVLLPMPQHSKGGKRTVKMPSNNNFQKGQQNFFLPTGQIKGMQRLLANLKSHYRIKEINVVSHSAGGVMFLQTLLATKSTIMPQIKHFIPIAGHFNGYIGDNNRGTSPNTNYLTSSGRPKIMTEQYRQLLKQKSNFPKQTKVLNIYGDLGNGSHSDGTVINESSRSLHYLVGMRNTNYHERKFTGSQYRHGKQVGNRQIQKLVFKTLYR